MPELSEPDSSSINNSILLSQKYFDEYTDVRDFGGAVIGRIHIKHAKNPIGNVYTAHGYWGAPTEASLFCVTESAHRNGFNVIGLEGCALSVTDTAPKKINKTTPGNVVLRNHKLAMGRMLAICQNNEYLAKFIYNMMCAHSYGCRVMTDFIFSSSAIVSHISEFLLTNGYWFMPGKLRDSEKEYMSRDSSGKMWNRILSGSFKGQRHIDNETYDCRSYTNNLYLGLPASWPTNLSAQNEIAARVVEHGLITDPVTGKKKAKKKVKILMGDKDDMADYNEFSALMNKIPAGIIETETIHGLGHYMEEDLAKLCEYMDHFFADRRTMLTSPKLIVDMTR